MNAPPASTPVAKGEPSTVSPQVEGAQREPMLSVDNLVKVFRAGRGHEDVVAVNGISFSVQRGDLFTLLGPSGCGKTTTLRSIAGLETPTSGEIAVDDRVLFSSSKRVSVRANQRGLGMVFQSYAIWPHMDVKDNVAYPLTAIPRRRRPPRRQIEQRVQNVLSIVQLDHLAERASTDLSGGQQQRLALARALIMEPPLLLLDEPLSNLDAKLREGMRLELKRLQRELGITAVYVTHDQVEAMAISNVVAVMDQGAIQQVGKPREIYEKPANRFVADFIGTTNFVEGTVRELSGAGGCVVDTPQGPVRATSGAVASHAVGDRVVLSIRPEHVALSTDEAEPGPNRWRGRVLNRAFIGEAVDHVVLVSGEEIRVRCNPRVSIRPGVDVTLTMDADTCHILPRA